MGSAENFNEVLRIQGEIRALNFLIDGRFEMDIMEARNSDELEG